MSQLLSNGSPEEVFNVSKEAIAVTGPGYFIGSTTELDDSAKHENILLMQHHRWLGNKICKGLIHT
jgi:hypothetical protein